MYRLMIYDNDSILKDQWVFNSDGSIKEFESEQEALDFGSNHIHQDLRYYVMQKISTGKYIQLEY